MELRKKSDISIGFLEYRFRFILFLALMIILIIEFIRELKCVPRDLIQALIFPATIKLVLFLYIFVKPDHSVQVPALAKISQCNT